MYPWPKCIKCNDEMPFLAGSRSVELHHCPKCEKIVMVTGDEMVWFTAIYTLKERFRRFLHLPGER